MAFPVVETTATTNGTTASTAPVVNLPSGIVAGETLVVLIRVAVAGAIGWPGGWTELFDASSDGADDQMAAAWRKADGTEGATITLSSGNGKFSALAYRISGATDPTVTPPELSAVAFATNSNPDPSTATPTGGAKDYLWLWLGGWEGEQTSPPAGTPLNYTNALGASSGTAGVIATNCRVASARRELNAASENPGIWIISASDDWTAYTMAVHPAPPVITPGGIATAEAFGSAREVLALAAAGVASAEAIGAAVLSAAITLLPAGIAPAEAFGAAVQSFGVAPGGVATAETFGTATERLALTPSAIPSGEAHGATLERLTLFPTGAGPAEAFGAAVERLTLASTAIPSGEAHGASTIQTGATIAPAAIGSAEAFGLLVERLTLATTGVGPAETFGSGRTVFVLAPGGVGSAGALGSPRLTFVVTPSGVAAAEAFGTGRLVLRLAPSGAATAEAFGDLARPAVHRIGEAVEGGGGGGAVIVND